MIEIYRVEPSSHSLKSGYDTLYASAGIRQRKSFYLWLTRVMNRVRPLSNALLLDVACGEGELVRVARNCGSIAIGIDISATALKRSQLRDAVLADGEKLPFPEGSFDWVTCIGSLEHYVNPDIGASEIARVLKREGRSCILLPNAYSLFGNIRHVLQRGEVFDDGQPIQRYGTRVSWSRLLERNGLSVEKVVKYELFPPSTYMDLAWFLGRPTKLLHLLFSLFLPLDMACCFVFICKKA